MKISHPNGILEGELNIAGSKSESNRALMIQAYMGQKCDLLNLSDSNDTRLLSRLLNEIESSAEGSVHTIDCADAGSVCRFLTSFLAQKKGQWMLTGTERLRQRPIATLVDALRQLGADIAYAQQDGRLPLIIKGARLVTKTIDVDISMSSQFASSLLMLLPTLGEPVQVRLVGELSSLPYLDMTIGMMNHFGAKVSRNDRTINVFASCYKPGRYCVSPDWSSVSYWLEAAALSKDCSILIKGLKPNTMQGDRAAADMFGKLGVSCTFTDNGMLIGKKKNTDKNLLFDFTHTPDLFPAVAATCAALNLKAVFKGLQNLKYKESDRVEAVVEELSKMDARFDIQSDCLVLEKGIDTQKTPVFSVHNDHRMAMSLSLLALKCPKVEMFDTDTVKKSYPDFWNDMASLGFANLTSDC